MRAATITIPQPCAESWAAMSPAGTGRHCATCQKTVVDFTHMSTQAVIAYLADPAHHDSCGRLRSGQLNPPQRLLTWRAAPRLALSVAAILMLTHCTADPSVTPVSQQEIHVPQSTRMVRGRVLDRATRKPLAQALIICEADTLCQTRTDADGAFTLAVPLKLFSSKLIAAVTKRPTQAGPQEDWLMQYIPHYFTAGGDVTVLLRRPPMIMGRTKLEPGETQSSVIRPCLVSCGAVPPPPKLTTIKFTPPTKE